MIGKLNQIILFCLSAFCISMILYPIYIHVLRKRKVGKTIREDAVTGDKASIFQALHQHKSGTPNMGGGMFLIVMLIMIGVGYLVQYLGWTNNSLVNRQETYVLLFAFFSLGVLGLVDDYLNVKAHSSIKGMSARMKLLGMIIIAAFISRWFFDRLDISYINLRPITGKVYIGRGYPILTFFLTIFIVNAINITDGLDGLAGGLVSIILMILAIVTFSYQTYIATTVLGILIAVLIAFLRFNINPAKIFMGDSGAYALGGLLASLIYTLNMRMGILIPFLVIFAIFIAEISSSFLQIMRKKILKRKLFPVAPLHHFFEYKGDKETTIVMKARLIQGVLAAIAIILVFYEFSGSLLGK